MKALVKVAAGIVLLLLAVFCFSKFHAQYAKTEIKYGEGDAEATNAAAAASTTNATTAPSTNSGAAVPPDATNGDTNATAAVSTNTPDAAATTNTAAVGAKTPPTTPIAKPANRDSSSAFGWMGGFILSLLALGLLGAWTVAQWFAGRAHSAVFATDAPPANDPEYDAAEAQWTNGNYLAAIEMMREYLKRFPSEQFVAIRIAEIYEKDLSNYPAAALELEEVLNKKLGREKWGWTAIHLANIYSGRLGQPEKALEVLRRIVKEAPNTAAAKKATERLGPDASAARRGEESSEPESQQNMPKGFAPKKK